MHDFSKGDEIGSGILDRLPGAPKDKPSNGQRSRTWLNAKLVGALQGTKPALWNADKSFYAPWQLERIKQAHRWWEAGRAPSACPAFRAWL